jgi:hypothetical protein
MRSKLGRFHRPMSRGAMGDMLTMNSLGDGSTLSLDFTTGVLDSRLTFSRAGGGTYVGADGYIYGVDSATSASLAIGTGSKSVTLTATAGVDRRFQVGQTVYFSSGANNMSGLVTAYNASTQVITINATATTGSGSFTSWFVGNASPRFDYSPTNIGEPRGLLIEGSSINLTTYSQNIENAVWTKDASVGSTNPDVTTPSVTSPANGTTVNQIVFNRIVGGFSRVSRTSVGTSAAPYTMSVWMRTVSGTANVGLRIGADPDGFKCAVSTTWQRFQYTYTLSSTSSDAQIMLWENIVGTDLTATVYVWGCQVEAGVAASSYIPTGASGVTRNADHCTIPTSSFISGNPYPQTLFVDCIPNTPNGAFLDIVRIFDRTVGGTFSYGTEIYYYNASTMTISRKIAASTNTERSFASGLTYGTRHKLALSIDASSFSGSYDGVASLGVATAPTALATVATHLGVGCSGDSAPNAVMFGTIRQIKFWPSALSQSQINTLTTL